MYYFFRKQELVPRYNSRITMIYFSYANQSYATFWLNDYMTNSKINRKVQSGLKLTDRHNHWTHTANV